MNIVIILSVLLIMLHCNNIVCISCSSSVEVLAFEFAMLLATLDY